MISIQPQPEITRRQMIERLGGGLGLAGLLPLLTERPAAAATLHFQPRAKRVIHLFMNGGPFQADFFDPKPLLAKYEGQRPQEVELRTERTTAGLLASPFAYARHGTSGLPISELLPNLAKSADDLCVLRSLYTDNPNHGPALYQMNNGTITPRRPSMGSWFLYGLGSENENLPGYVVLCPEGKFADACLLARRLAERGVRFTQIYYGNGQPWDTHVKHHDKVRTLARTIDQPIAALLNDLKRTGLLDDTLVIWGGEFGRTPTSENGDGRDHNHYGFTMWLAGGGVRGGTTYGETDNFGFRAVHDKVHIHDLHATILYLLGLDHEKLTYRYSGRDFRLTDVHGRILHEIVA